MQVSRLRIPMGGVPAGAVNAYLLGDDPALLVDPGAETDALTAAVEEREVGAVAVTHTHPDHAGAVAAYAERTGATVCARRWREDRFRRAAGVEPDRSLAGGDAVAVGDGAGTAGVGVLETPGHAVDHLAFSTPEGVCCGDLAIAEGSLAVTAPEGDMRAYLTSLRRLHARDPPALLPGHGPPVDDARSTLRRLLDHRRGRERRVRRAVEGGARDLEAVLDAAYDKDLSGVRSLARGTVEAHLEKLAVEGAVRWDPRTRTARPA